MILNIDSRNKLSKIDVSTFRVDNQSLLRARVRTGTMDCEYSSFQFLDKDKNNLRIVSTSSGFIGEDVVRVTGTSDFIEIFMDHPNEIQQCECLISFLNGNNLINSESLYFTPITGKGMSPSLSDIQTIKSRGINFDDRMKQMKDRLEYQLSSKWRIQLRVQDDIILRINSKANKRALACLGESSVNLISSDFVFFLYPTINKMVIPREVIWKNHGKYTSDTLCCFELVKADFHRSENSLYKSKISNSIHVYDISKDEKVKIDDFRQPTGAMLDDNWSISNQSSLPIYRGST